MAKILNYNDFKIFLRKDFQSQGRKNAFKDFFLYPICRYTFLLRLNEYLRNCRYPLLVRLIPHIWFKKLGVSLGFSIPFNVFDYGLGLIHYGLIIVNSDARIGKNCRIHAGVNIGASAKFKAKGDTKSYSPTIGDNCYIGPGAKLFGPITIGSNCVIGANAVVNKNFHRDNITIAGIPAKIISEKGSYGMVPINI